MANVFITTIEFDNFLIPVKVFKEWRSSVRFSIGKKNAIVRIPRIFTKTLMKIEMARLEIWLKAQFKKHPKIATRFIIKHYQTGDELFIRDQKFRLNIIHEDRRTNSAVIQKRGIIDIKLSSELNKYEQADVTQKLIARTISKYFKPEIEARVYEINKNYFGKEIQSIKLKSNQSNWGSCSTKKNINLSNRLLLAPQEVLDYVIVHELAHLIEMNHSNKFWNIVERVMPDYKEKETWLEKHGHSLIF